MSEETNKIDNGGPAFPDPGAAAAEYHGHTNFDLGMSLHDYFFAKAMQGLLANPGGPVQARTDSGWGLVNCQIGDVVNMALNVADAMLAARNAEGRQ